MMMMCLLGCDDVVAMDIDIDIDKDKDIDIGTGTGTGIGIGIGIGIGVCIGHKVNALGSLRHCDDGVMTAGPIAPCCTEALCAPLSHILPPVVHGFSKADF